MKVVFAVMATAITLAPVAFANSLVINHDQNSITLTSDHPADQGTVTLTDFAFIKNTSGAKSLTIQGFEFYFGGNPVPGVAGDTPSTFLSAGNGWTYSIGEGDLASAKGSGWSQNHHPITIGDAVQPTDSSPRDYISSISIVNSPSSGFCYTGEVLAAGAECQVELDLTANYGGAMGSKSDTFIYGFAEGKLSGGGAGAVTDSQFQGMEERIKINVAPEPGSLVLLGSGFGLFGLVAFLRRRATAQVTIA
ncbi:MAG: PEP-CTERM sorting domain-containing protein [Terracidiphilus sp.]